MLRRAKDSLSMFFSSNQCYSSKPIKKDVESCPCNECLNIYPFFKLILIYRKSRNMSIRQSVNDLRWQK